MVVQPFYINVEVAATISANFFLFTVDSSFFDHVLS